MNTVKFPFASDKYEAPKYKGLEVFSSADREAARQQAKNSK